MEGRALDVDHLGAELSEMGRRPRSGDEPGGVEDPNPGERSIHGYEGTSADGPYHRCHVDPVSIRGEVHRGTSPTK
jgi:hypothetical protein